MTKNRRLLLSGLATLAVVILAPESALARSRPKPPTPPRPPRPPRPPGGIERATDSSVLKGPAGTYFDHTHEHDQSTERFRERAKNEGYKSHLDQLGAQHGMSPSLTDLVVEFQSKDTILVSTNAVLDSIYTPILLTSPDVLLDSELLAGLRHRVLGSKTLRPDTTLRIIASPELRDTAFLDTFARDSIKRIDASLFAEIEVTTRSSQTYRMKAFKFGKDRSRWLYRYGECCLFTRGYRTSAQKSRSSKPSFDRLQIISLFNDTRTAANLKPLGSKTVLVAHPDELPGDPTDAVVSRLKNVPSNTLVIVVGHVIGEDFVIEGNAPYQLPIKTIVDAAQNQNVHLALFGCETGLLALSEGSLAAPLAKIYPRELTKRLQAALPGSKTHEDLLRALSTEDEPIIIDFPTAKVTSSQPTATARLVRVDKVAQVQTKAQARYYPACTNTENCRP